MFARMPGPFYTQCMPHMVLLIATALLATDDTPNADVYRFDLRSQDEPVFARVLRDFGDERGWYIELDNPLRPGMTRTISRSDVIYHRPARDNERDEHLAAVFQGSGQVPVVAEDGTVIPVPEAEFELARRAQERAQEMEAARAEEAARMPEPETREGPSAGAGGVDQAPAAEGLPRNAVLAVAGGIAAVSLVLAGLVLKFMVFA